MQIVPMRDLKDTVKIERLCSESKAPVFVTKNGYGKLVIMDMDTFERLFAEAARAKAINEGLDELSAGKIKDGPETIEGLRKKYGL